MVRGQRYVSKTTLKLMNGRVVKGTGHAGYCQCGGLRVNALVQRHRSCSTDQANTLAYAAALYNCI